MDKKSEEYEAAYKRAEKKVKARVDFFWHLAAYLAVNGFLFLIWLFTGLGYPWFIWPALGWGLGLFFHFVAVFVFGTRAVEEYTRRKIEEEVRKELGGGE